jgi:hypothetical protein
MTKKEKEQYLNQKEILGIAPYGYEVLDIICKNNIWKIILRWENSIKEKMIYYEHPTNVLFDGKIRIDKENLKLNKIKIN